MFECVINISEGRDLERLDLLSTSVTSSLRDRHHDRFHNRSVFTLINEASVLRSDVHSLIDTAFRTLDLRTHEGVHPRFGVVDVVPFVALEEKERPRALALRDETARWIAEHYDVPTFLYGDVDGRTRTLPEVRREAFRLLQPDVGPFTRMRGWAPSRSANGRCWWRGTSGSSVPPALGRAQSLEPFGEARFERSVSRWASGYR